MNDPISRNAAIKAIHDEFDECLVWDESGEYTANEVERVLNELPTIEPKHGQFLGTEYDGFADGNPVYYEWVCSECGCIFEDEEPTYNYCPNCGAKMERSEE